MIKSSKVSTKAQVNSRLAAALGIDGQNDNAASVPLSALPSTYAEIVYRKRQDVPKDYPENKYRLTCRECGRGGQYDLGLIGVHPNLFEKGNSFADASHEEEHFSKVMQNIDEYIQFTGYFRCKHCNAGGGWSFGNDFIMFLLVAMFRYSVTDDDESAMIQFGRFQSFDGYEPKSATDAEEHLLDLLARKPDDAFLWNRLGNVYSRGGAPELAVIAFEQSLRCDSAQVESHALLANILYHIDELEACIRHSHLALAHARFYTKIESQRLREMIRVLLRNLLDASMALGNIDLFLPSRELMEAAALQHRQPVAQSSGSLDFRSFDLDSDDIDSFTDLADVYVGSRGKTRKQTRFRIHNKKKKRRR